MPQQHKKMLEQTCITYNEVCIIIHQGLQNTETLLSRPRLFLQDQDFYFKTKTKTIFHVLEAPRDQDQGLETNPCILETFPKPISWLGMEKLNLHNKSTHSPIKMYYNTK